MRLVKKAALGPDRERISRELLNRPSRRSMKFGILAACYHSPLSAIRSWVADAERIPCRLELKCSGFHAMNGPPVPLQPSATSGA
jgi:hypothetical protein